MIPGGGGTHDDTGAQDDRLSVADLTRAEALYGKLLGVEPSADKPYYAGFRAGDVQVGLDPRGRSKRPAGPVGYWHVPDINGHHLQLLDAGSAQAPCSPSATRAVARFFATVNDADGHIVGPIQEPADPCDGREPPR